MTNPSDTSPSTNSPSNDPQHPPVAELFDSGRCDARYPVSDYVQTFEFAQFIDLMAEPPKPDKDSSRSFLDLRQKRAVPLVTLNHDAELNNAIVRAAETGQTLVRVLDGLPLTIAASDERSIRAAFSKAPQLIEITESLHDKSLAERGEVLNSRLGFRPDESLLKTIGDSSDLVFCTSDADEFRVLRMVPGRGPEPLGAWAKPAVERISSSTTRPDQKTERPVQEPPLETIVVQYSAVVPWTQKWKLLGYSRGKLVQSLTLAPQEETTIELFSWDRRKRSLEQTSQTDTESSTEFDSKQQDSIDTLRELISGNEMNRELGAQFHASYGTSDQTYVKLDAHGKLSAKDSVTQTARTTGKRLSDMTQKASSRVKTQRTSKITEASELGREERVTRKIRNQNMCRTLSFDYFELMVSYKVETAPDPDGIILCAMLTNPFADPKSTIHVPKFEPDHLRIYDSLLRPALLNDELVSGFAAARLLAAREAARAVACDEYGCKKNVAATPATETSGTGTYQPPAFASLSSWPLARDTGFVLAGIASALFDASGKAFCACYPDGRRGGASAEAVLELRRCVYGQLLKSQMPDFAARLEALKLYAGATAANPPQDIEGYRAALAALSLVTPSGPGSGAAGALGSVRRAPASVIDPIIDAELHSYISDESHRDFVWGKAAWWGAWNPDDAGLPAALDRFTGAFAAFSRAAAESASPPAGTSDEPSSTEAAAQVAQSNEDRMAYDFPTREVAEAMERQTALLLHLNLFLDYYRYVLLRGLPPAEQLSRLVTGLPRGQTTRLLQPRILAWRGHQVAVPVDIGVDSGLKDLRDSLAEGVAEAGPVAPFFTSMPTPGLALETRLGQCSGCEPFIEETREIELRQRMAAAELAELEARRARLRLESTPPDLNDPRPPASTGLVVRLEQTGS